MKTTPLRTKIFTQPGSAYPLRATTPNGATYAVNRDFEGLFVLDSRGEWKQIEGTSQFRARNGSRFAAALRKRYGIGEGGRTWEGVIEEARA